MPQRPQQQGGVDSGFAVAGVHRAGRRGLQHRRRAVTHRTAQCEQQADQHGTEPISTISPPSRPTTQSRCVRAAAAPAPRPVMRRNARRGRLASRIATSNFATPRTGCSLPALGAARLERVDRDLHRVGQVGVLGVGVLERGDDRLGRAAHHDEMRLVGDRPVVGDPVQLRRFGLAVVSDLGHAQLDLVRLGLLGEDGAQRLRVDVGQLPAGDVAAVVGVAAGVGELDAAAAQVVELVELGRRRRSPPGRRVR